MIDSESEFKMLVPFSYCDSKRDAKKRLLLRESFFFIEVSLETSEKVLFLIAYTKRSFPGEY